VNAVMEQKDLLTSVEGEVRRRQNTCRMNLNGILGQIGEAAKDAKSKKCLEKDLVSVTMVLKVRQRNVEVEVQMKRKSYQIYVSGVNGETGQTGEIEMVVMHSKLNVIETANAVMAPLDRLINVEEVRKKKVRIIQILFHGGLGHHGVAGQVVKHKT